MSGEASRRVERALEEIRQGRIVILCDDEDRENEGDLCMAADAATPEAIAFMAAKGRGLICVALTPERVEQLRLPMMVRDNRSRFGTNFTVSIEARQGVSTGISAADRATTIRIAADPERGAVDLARLAGRIPAGVICEIMNEDGTMARRPELEKFAQEHDLAMLCVADVIAYRLQRERLVKRVAVHDIELDLGDGWTKAQAHVYDTIPGIDGEDPIVALVLGDPTRRPALVRVHRECWATDALHIRGIDRLHVPVLASLRAIRDAGGGVFLRLPAAHDLHFADLLGMRHPPDRGPDPKAERPPVTREFGIGAQILRDLGVEEFALITNSPRLFLGLEGFGLRIVEYVDPSSTTP